MVAYRRFLAPAVLTGLLACSIASASDFVSYEGNNSVQVGSGGEKHVVNGVDFWANGAPPRKFKIIGYISNSRVKMSGLFGRMQMSHLESHIAKETKQAGGDAVILTDDQVVTTDYTTHTQTNSTGTGNTSGNFNANTYGNTTTGTFGAMTTGRAQTNTTTYSTASQDEQMKYAVIKCLADDSSQITNADASSSAKAAQPK